MSLITILPNVGHDDDKGLWLSCRRRRDHQTCTCRATSGSREEVPAGTRTLAIA